MRREEMRMARECVEDDDSIGNGGLETTEERRRGGRIGTKVGVNVCGRNCLCVRAISPEQGGGREEGKKERRKRRKEG